MLSGEIAHGVKEDEAGEVGKLARDLVGLGVERDGLRDEGGRGIHARFGPVDTRWAFG